MPKNKPIPEALLSRLHGKGSMSEVLQIERDRLLQKSQEEMQQRLSPPSNTAGPEELEISRRAPSIESASKSPPEIQPSSMQEEWKTEPAVVRSGSEPHFVPGTGYVAPGLPTLPVRPMEYHERLTSSNAGKQPQAPVDAGIGNSARIEGLSRSSRVVGDDLSEFGRIVRHSAASVREKTWPLPPAVQRYYAESVDPALPFTAQRNLLVCVRLLTMSWGTLTCQIPLDLLAATAHIRNLKTLRKWLADLQGRKHIKYTPIHGDLRGSLVTITPPHEIVAYIEQWWKQNPDAVPTLPHNITDGSDSQVEGNPVGSA